MLLANVRHHRQALAILFFVAAVLTDVPAANAMSVVQRDFSELVARAEQIVIGTVSTVREEQDASGVPYTLVTLADLSVLKGDASATLTLRFYGGTAGDVTVHIPDMPVFTVGERDVLFVAGNGTTICPLVGVWQGRFFVRADPALGTDVVEDSNHKPLYGIANRTLLQAPTAESTGPMTLDDFRQAITNELAQPHINQ